MEIKVVKCDIKSCQKEIKDPSKVSRRIFSGLEYDLCEECAQKMDKFIKEFLLNGRMPIQTSFPIYIDPNQQQILSDRTIWTDQTVTPTWTITAQPNSNGDIFYAPGVTVSAGGQDIGRLQSFEPRTIEQENENVEQIMREVSDTMRQEIRGFIGGPNTDAIIEPIAINIAETNISIENITASLFPSNVNQ